MTGSQSVGVVHDDLDAGTAAAAAVASGEKKEVALLPSVKEGLASRKEEKTAAKEAAQREAEKQDAKETQHVQNLAHEQLAKATAAFSAEIEAVAGPEEAGRLKQKLGESEQGQTALEREAAEAAKKTSSDSMAHRIANSLFLRGLLEVSSADHTRTRRARLQKRRQEAASTSNTTHTDNHTLGTGTHLPSLGDSRRNKMANLQKLVAEADAALKRLKEEVELVGREATADEENLLQEISKEFDNVQKPSVSQRGEKRRWERESQSSKAAVRPEDYALTRERLGRIAQDGLVMVTWANHYYLDFATNWLRHLHQLGITCYMIGAMDNVLLQALVDASEENVFAMQSGLDEKDLGWGSLQFHKMGREKISLILNVAQLGFDVLVSDIDTAWLKNPIPYIARFPDADVLTSSDHLANTTNDDGLELYPEAGSAFNIGIILMRKSALALAKEWDQALSKEEKYWDQHAFNDLLRKGFDTHNAPTRREDRLFKAYDGKLLAGVLPVALFASGHTFYVQDLAGRMGLAPYVAHNTYQFAGTPGKRHRFRERHIWLADDPEYYDPPGGLLSLDLQLDAFLGPASRLDVHRTEDPIQLDAFLPHFNLVNAQLRQIRHAMVLCTILKRTLLLPRIMVGADRFWAPHLGIIPGAVNLTLPRHVPADFIFDLDTWSRQGHDDFAIPFREHSMLTNPKAPPELAKSRVEVSVCKHDADGCISDASQVVSTAAIVQLKPALKDKDVAKILQVYKDVKILHIRDLTSPVGEFASEEDAKRFEEQIKSYVGIWCCATGSPGHVWYDFFWDVPNHHDRHGRLIEKWKPIMGP